jgi:transposase
MLYTDMQVKIWLYAKSTDMRKSFDGVMALAENKMQEDPLSGGLFIFINRRQTHIKILYFDRSTMPQQTQAMRQSHAYQHF